MSNGRKSGKVLKLQLRAEKGAIAENPDKVFQAVLGAACSDGASVEEWSEAIVKAAGGRRKSVPVNSKAKFRFLKDIQDRQVAVYKKALQSAVSEIEKVLLDAEENAPRPSVGKGL